jgi:asparagine synthase (glutamine-hydrolysing)
MCGIAGVAQPGLTPQRATEWLSAMCGAMAHRGPDDEGHFVAPGIALGMRRLSIIDVAGGHQPIGNEDGSIQVVFNGEIYNHHQLRGRLEPQGHRFRTRSDTETIVHGYEEFGDRVVDQLRGMFGLALWDQNRSRLLIARDRLGIKPLYYWSMPDGGLAFCSELRCLLALPEFTPSVSHEAVARYLGFGYVPEPLAILDGVHKVPPGHLLTWEPGRPPVVTRYWSPVRPEASVVDEEEAVTELRRLLQEAVACHLESEVPLGAFLSGGLDSATVVALMSRALSRRVQTFTIGFDEGGYNEAPAAAEVARALGTEHTELVVRPDADALVEGLVAAFDEPFADSSAIPTYLVAQLARTKVTVALSGDGGDELFGGYTRYLQTLRRRPLPSMARPWLRGLGRLAPHAAPGRNYLLDLSRPWEGRYAATVAMPLAPAEGGVARPDLVRFAGPFEAWLAPRFEAARSRDFATRMTLVDLETYLPGDILTKVDRTTMAVSLEARVPLLDHPLVEFAVSLPARLKFREGQGKHIFRRAIAPLVPAAVLTRPKQGFAIPLDRWFRGPLRHRLESLRMPTRPVYQFVAPAAVDRLIAEHLRRRRDHSYALWRILVLDLWLTHLADGRLSLPTSNPFAAVH